MLRHSPPLHSPIHEGTKPITIIDKKGEDFQALQFECSAKAKYWLWLGYSVSSSIDFTVLFFFWLRPKYTERWCRNHVCCFCCCCCIGKAEQKSTEENNILKLSNPKNKFHPSLLPPSVRHWEGLHFSHVWLAGKMVPPNQSWKRCYYWSEICVRSGLKSKLVHTEAGTINWKQIFSKRISLNNWWAIFTNHTGLIAFKA